MNGAPKVGPAPQRADSAVLRAQAADKLTDIVLGDPEAEWARYALEVVLRQGVELDGANQ